MDRNEIRRLQKAAKDNNKMALWEWGTQFEEQVRQELQVKFEKFYKEQVQDAIDTFSLVIAYTFLFSEEVNIDKENLADFMDDLFSTVHLFNTGEYKPEDYAEQMKEQGVDIYDIIERRKEKENILEDK